MPTALIADDEPHLANYLSQRLATLWPELELVGIAHHGLEAQEWLVARQPDIAFLDIKMPGLTGLQVAEQAHCHCVFITAFQEFAVTAFEHNAVDYLLKPISDERLGQTITRLKQRLVARQAPPELGSLLQQLQQAISPHARAEKLRWIRAGIGHDIRLVAVDDVAYFQASDKYTAVVTREGEYLIRTPLKELLDQLDTEHFWQIHRGTVVNVRQIREASRDLLGKLTVRLKDRDEKLAVSRAFAHLFKQM
ncbi:DNA-binding LytR/AlgR family response regulator [Chitinivorax tropicus]|uniref:DNA-binding LytR/AlgR family response regulator n=1 Tax=Chitinivorax tropicus TaxID=714531 RepID=A0A840MJP9_9PROT|nr:LytTR family DNA-binding domain-containing protein [Chitinivorax tropicus]MBB5017399.1 DNA-binding LytR/AlgR family response regulator [Chitinivorax tropicus]